MGGVDLSDALIGYYNVLHKTTKWYKTFFFHFVDIAVVNSFILYQHLLTIQNKSPVNQKDFRERLVSELVKNNTQPKPSSAKAPSTPKPSRSVQKEPEPKPEEEQWLSDYFWSDGASGRRACVVCKLSGLTRVLVKMQCGVVLCAFKELLQNISH